MKTLKPYEKKRNAKNFDGYVYPTKVRWEAQETPAKITFSDGSISVGSCIRCVNAPCIEYSPQELTMDIFSEFPSDKKPDICPTSAITRSMEDDAPQVEPSKCILCGICVARCPVKAIHLTTDRAVVNDAPNQYFQEVDFEADNAFVQEMAGKFDGVEETGSYLNITDDNLQTVYSKLNQVDFDINLLARNLLIGAGVNAAMRRKGDTNIRMDMVISSDDEKLGVVEVERGNDTLSALRSLLDDIAILVSRYDVKKDDLIPLVVALELPNLRTEFWMLVKDIRQTLNVSINTVTIGMLIIAIWARKNLVFDNSDEFYIDIDNPSLKSKLEALLGEVVSLNQGYRGLLESLK